MALDEAKNGTESAHLVDWPFFLDIENGTEPSLTIQAGYARFLEARVQINQKRIDGTLKAFAHFRKLFAAIQTHRRLLAQHVGALGTQHREEISDGTEAMSSYEAVCANIWSICVHLQKYRAFLVGQIATAQQGKTIADMAQGISRDLTAVMTAQLEPQAFDMLAQRLETKRKPSELRGVIEQCRTELQDICRLYQSLHDIYDRLLHVRTALYSSNYGSPPSSRHPEEERVSAAS